MIWAETLIGCPREEAVVVWEMETQDGERREGGMEGSGAGRRRTEQRGTELKGEERRGQETTAESGRQRVREGY